MSYYVDYFNQFEQFDNSILEKQEENLLASYIHEQDSTSGSPFSYDGTQNLIKHNNGLFSPKQEDLGNQIPYQSQTQHKKIFDIIRINRSQVKKYRVTQSEDNILASLSQNSNQQYHQSNYELKKLVKKNKRLIRREIAKNRKRSTEFLQSQLSNTKSKSQFPVPLFSPSQHKTKMYQMIRNRISAQISRDKKKMYINELENENKQLKLQNEILKKEILNFTKKQQLLISNEITSQSSNQNMLKVGFAITALVTLLAVANVPNGQSENDSSNQQLQQQTQSNKSLIDKSTTEQNVNFIDITQDQIEILQDSTTSHLQDLSTADQKLNIVNYTSFSKSNQKLDDYPTFNQLFINEIMSHKGNP